MAYRDSGVDVVYQLSVADGYQIVREVSLSASHLSGFRQEGDDAWSRVVALSLGGSKEKVSPLVDWLPSGEAQRLCAWLAEQTASHVNDAKPMSSPLPSQPDPLLWGASWVERRIADRLLSFFAWVVVPGFLLFVWHAIEGSGGWVMSLSSMVIVFLFLPYALLRFLWLIVQLSFGGDQYNASLRFSSDEGGDAYREDEGYQLESVCRGSLRSMILREEHLEGFAQEPMEAPNGLVYGFRVTALVKNAPALILFENVPSQVSRDAITWLCEKTKRPVPAFY